MDIGSVYLRASPATTLQEKRTDILMQSLLPNSIAASQDQPCLLFSMMLLFMFIISPIKETAFGNINNIFTLTLNRQQVRYLLCTRYVGPIHFYEANVVKNEKKPSLTRISASWCLLKVSKHNGNKVNKSSLTQ